MDFLNVPISDLTSFQFAQLIASISGFLFVLTGSAAFLVYTIYSFFNDIFSYLSTVIKRKFIKSNN